MFNSCGDKSKIIELNRSDLIPEGIAVDESSGDIYLSNLYTRNIIHLNENSTDSKKIESPFNGLVQGFGIEQINGKIYALGNYTKDSIYFSVLQIIDSKTKKMLKSIELESEENSILNDLVVTRSGDIYFTNSLNNSIYTLDEGQDKFKVLFSSDEIPYPNGITLSVDEDKLFIASSRGIRIYHLKMKKFLNKADNTTLTKGVDGLKYYKNSLIGVQNWAIKLEDHAVVRFYLNDNETEITHVDTLVVDHPNFDIPTTLDIKGDWVYCLANSQMDNLDEENNLIRKDELTATYILKLKIE
jgi:DNA-binding beta-propeller fold protein YncE